MPVQSFSESVGDRGAADEREKWRNGRHRLCTDSVGPRPHPPLKPYTNRSKIRAFRFFLSHIPPLKPVHPTGSMFPGSDSPLTHPPLQPYTNRSMIPRLRSPRTHLPRPPTDCLSAGIFTPFAIDAFFARLRLRRRAAVSVIRIRSRSGHNVGEALAAQLGGVAARWAARACCDMCRDVGNVLRCRRLCLCRGDAVRSENAFATWN
jgi:hypothetical protein